MPTLSEDESATLVARYGVPVVERRRAGTADEAVAAAAALGMPVVVKLHGDAIAHKTERGLVRIGLRDPGAVRAAADELLACARPEDGAVDLLVARMAGGSRELVAGVHDDPQFGRCVMVGVGGVLTEVLADVTFRLAPITRVDAEEMLDDLVHAELLGPVRGEPAVDRGALTHLLLALSDLATSERDVVAVDVNPIVIEQGRPVAVDALVEVAG